MIKKFVSILALFAALVVLLSLCTAAALKIFFPEPRLQRMFVNGIRGYTQRDASVKRVSWRLFSGFRATGFALSEHPDFKAGTFLTVKTLTVETGILQFFRHTTGSVSLDSPALAVTIGKRAPPPSLPHTPAQPGRAKHAGYAPPVIPRFSLSDGVVDFIGGRAGTRIAWVESLNLSADEVTPLRPFSALASGIIRSGSVLLLAECTAVVDIPERRILIRNAVLKSGAASLRVNGSISGISEPDGMTYDLTVQGDRAVLDEMLTVVSRTEIIQLMETETIHLRITGTKDTLKAVNLSR